MRAALTIARSQSRRHTIHHTHACHQESKLVIAGWQDHNGRKPGSQPRNASQRKRTAARRLADAQWCRAACPAGATERAMTDPTYNPRRRHGRDH
jgi:hypothetical protein